MTDDRFDPNSLDTRSYNLGMVYAFAECVGSGVKRLALSPPLSRGEFEVIIEDVERIAREYDVTLHVDEEFLGTKLFNPEFTRGKIVIHLAEDEATVDVYRALKEMKREHLEAGTLNDEVETEVAWGLGRLLSYSDDAIRELLENPRF